MIKEVDQFLSSLKINMPAAQKNALIKELDRNGDGIKLILLKN